MRLRKVFIVKGYKVMLEQNYNMLYFVFYLTSCFYFLFTVYRLCVCIHTDLGLDVVVL